jgi:hypothetical protein
VTEAEWVACEDPVAMLRYLSGADRRAAERRLRLFACGCGRVFWPDATDPRLADAIAAAERFADGEAGEDELARPRSRGRLLPGLVCGRLAAPPAQGYPGACGTTDRGVDPGRMLRDTPWADSGAGTAFPERTAEVCARPTQHRPAPEGRAKRFRGNETEDNRAARAVQPAGWEVGVSGCSKLHWPGAGVPRADFRVPCGPVLRRLSLRHQERKELESLRAGGHSARIASAAVAYGRSRHPPPPPARSPALGKTGASPPAARSPLDRVAARLPR